MRSSRQPCSGVLLSVFGVLVLLSLICGTHGRGNRVPVDSVGTKAQVCKSRECIDAANVIYVNRDASVEPCKNFWDFACGGWIRTHPVPENKTRWDQFQEASQVTNERLKEILEKEDKSDDTKSIKDARKFYRACLNTDNERTRNMAILLERLAVWGGWPMAAREWTEDKFDWKKLMVHLMRTSSEAPLLQISVGPDRHNTSRNVIIIDQGELGCRHLTSERHMLAMTLLRLRTAVVISLAATEGGSQERARARARLRRGVRNLAYHRLRRRQGKLRPDDDVGQMLLLEKQLCEALSSSADRENEFRMYNRKTIAELQNMTDAEQPLHADSKIGWVDLLNDFLEGSGIQVQENQTVIVAEESYVVKLIGIIDRTPRRTLANFLLWQKIADMLDEVSPQLRELSHDYKESVSGASGAVPRWETCVTQTNVAFTHAVGYEYVKLYFDADAKKNAEELVVNIVDAYIEELKEIDWMDGATRALAVEKANNLVVHVGYPAFYDNRTLVEDLYSEYEIGTSHLLNSENIQLSQSIEGAKSLDAENDRETWMVLVVDVNAYYSVEMNSIIIPAGIFQLPFYMKGRPEALNYGAIGAVIGHEISHAFDVSGMTADKVGNLVKWWSADTLQTYQVKQDCFEKQYGGYPVPELLGFEDAAEIESPVQLDGIGTVSENIADNGGVQEAFAAYRRSTRKHGVEPRLPGLTHYSPQQLFYIGYASVWCESGSQQSLVDDILTDTHSPSKYRVLIPLGNSKDFADSWKCRQNDFQMRPVRRCEFW